MVLEYYRPDNISEALACLIRSPRTTKIMAGGTDLIIRIREREISPEYLVDMGRVPGLREIGIDGETLSVGSMATFTEIENNHLIKEYMPMLALAAWSVGSPQIRNTGTIGGNIANAAPAADMIPPLLALEAGVELKSVSGQRMVGLQEILAGANKTNILPDEILTRVVIPLPGAKTYGSFIKLARRKALAIARLNLGLTITLDDRGRIAKTALALGCVGATAYRVGQVEELLTGRELSGALVRGACALTAGIVAGKLGSRPTAPYKQAIAKAALGKAFESIEAQIKAQIGGL